MDIKEIRTIIKNKPDVLSTHEKTRAFLADVFLNDQMRINVMMNAYDVGIIEAIKNPTSFTINQIISGIESRYGVSEARAKEAVEIWISILSQDGHDIKYQIHKERTVASESATTSSTHRPQPTSLHASNATVNSTQQSNSSNTQVASASVKQAQKVGQPNVLRQNPSSNTAQPVSNGVHPTLPQQPTTQKQTPTTVNTPPSLSASAYTTNVQQVQQTVSQNNLPTNATIQNAQAKRSKSATIVTIISVVTGVGILLIVGIVGFSISRLLKAKSEAIAQSEREESIAKSEREESIAKSEREESIAISESEAAASRATSLETTNNPAVTNSNTTRYIEHNFEGLSFEIPSDSTVDNTYNTQNEPFISVGFPSEGSVILLYSYALDSFDIEVDASTEAYFLQFMIQRYLEDQGATNIQRFSSSVDGMIAECALCNIESKSTEVFMFCSKDYSKMYLVFYQVINTSKSTDSDAEYFSHFINSIVITNSDTTSYKGQNFEGLSFEIPADSSIEINKDNPDETFVQSMLIEFNSASSYIMIFTMDISDKEIDASTEQNYVSTTMQNYLENRGAEDISQVSNKDIDGKLAEQVLCFINDKMTDVYVFLSKDYSKLYIVIFQVNELSVDDRINFNYFIDSIAIE